MGSQCNSSYGDKMLKQFIGLPKPQQRSGTAGNCTNETNTEKKVGVSFTKTTHLIKPQKHTAL